MGDLVKAALRTRHLKQLSRATKGGVTLTNEMLSRMNLKQFIALGLQHNTELVASIGEFLILFIETKFKHTSLFGGT